MIAVFVNMATVLVGSLLGILFRNRLKESFQAALMNALALCTAVIVGWIWGKENAIRHL